MSIFTPSLRAIPAISGTASRPLPLFSLVRQPIALAVCLLPTVSAMAQPYAPNQYVLQSEVQAAMQLLRQGQYSWPSRSSGLIEGQILVPDLVTDSADQFRGLNFTHTICIPNPFGGCLYSHDYGLKLDMNFGASGPLTLSYSVPFNVTFRFPVSVYPGQRIVLEPRIEWQSGASIAGQQSLQYHQTTTSVTDAPGDGMDDLTVAFSQFADRALLHLGLPLVPGLNSAPLDLPLGMPPFNQGGGSFGGSTTHLGGTGRLDNKGDIVFGQTETELSIGASSSNARLQAWRQSSEVFSLTSTVLGYVPTPQTQAASAVLSAVRAAGSFKLDVSLDGGISRTDIVSIALESQPLVVDVPSSLAPGDTWRFDNLALSLKYGVRSLTHTYYPLSLSVVFDMRGVDPATIAKQDLGEFWAGTREVPWQPRSTVVWVAGALPVVAKDKAPPALQLDARLPIARILAQPPADVRPVAPLACG